MREGPGEPLGFAELRRERDLLPVDDEALPDVRDFAGAVDDDFDLAVVDLQPADRLRVFEEGRAAVVIFLVELEGGDARAREAEDGGLAPEEAARDVVGEVGLRARERGPFDEEVLHRAGLVDFGAEIAALGLAEARAEGFDGRRARLDGRGGGLRGEAGGARLRGEGHVCELAASVEADVIVGERRALRGRRRAPLRRSAARVRRHEGERHSGSQGGDQDSKEQTLPHHSSPPSVLLR